MKQPKRIITKNTSEVLAHGLEVGSTYDCVLQDREPGDAMVVYIHNPKHVSGSKKEFETALVALAEGEYTVAEWTKY